MPKSRNVLNESILPWLVTILVPFALILGAVWVVLHPWFLDFEYHTPNFPPDPFGFTLQDRLHYSRIALDYLVNNAGISYLGDLHFPPGQQVPAESCVINQMTDCTRLYNDRELKHMVDVKRTVGYTLRFWYLVMAALLLLGVWAWQADWLGYYRKALGRGGWLTVILIAIILIFVLVAFDTFFTDFHNVFFPPGTWMFLYSDTLIRLFPERFWQDTFITVGSIAAVIGLVMGLFLRGPRKKTERVKISSEG